MNQFSNNYHVEYSRRTRHWSPLSERYAGGDCLLTAVDNGWSVDDKVYVEEFWHAGMRQVTVFHFDLKRGDDQMSMPVISNPFVRRMLVNLEVEVRPVAERDPARRRQRN